MSRSGWLTLAVLVLLPVNAWLWVFYYLHQQRKVPNPIGGYKEYVAFRVSITQEKWGIKEGQKLVYPFPVKGQTVLLGVQPPVGRGYPVLFINISWITEPDVFSRIIQEALESSPILYIALLSYPLGRPPYSEHRQRLQEMLKQFPHRHRISILMGEWVHRAFGGEHGILAFLCDSNGIVRAIEPYPSFKISRNWQEEVADWRPKLHQAVKKILDKFFPKGQRR
ncbi:hypothetical protein GG496_000795 [Candidatus Fervidibacteria bacterium JGI MDM2 JNZ-1-D12]